MADWRQLLQALLTTGSKASFPLATYKAKPPASGTWPASLPVCTPIVDFYRLCDGGYIGDYNWHGRDELAARTADWVDGTKGYYGDGRDAIISGRHVVLATDASGAPLVWDATTGLMATFWFKGGDWEPTGKDFEQFMAALFTPQGTDDLWAQAVHQLHDRSAAP